MPITINAYKCKHCGMVFTEKQQAIECEAIHVLSKDLEFVACRHLLSEQDILNGNDYNRKFPELILVDIKSYSGISAEYELKRVSSDEDFIDDYFQEEMD